MTRASPIFFPKDTHLIFLVAQRS